MTKKRGMRPEDLYQLKTVGDPRLSPDGTRVAYVVARADRESDEQHTTIWVAPTDGSGRPRPFTSGTKDGSPRWSPDGRRLAFVSDRGEKPQIFVAPLDGGEPRKLTSAPIGVSQPAWSPDGGSIAYVAAGARNWKDPKDRSPVEKNSPRVIRDLYYRLDGVGVFDDRRSHIHVVDVESGRSRQVTRGDWNDAWPSWSPDGRSLAFASDRQRGRRDRLGWADVWVVDVRSGRTRKLTRSRGAAAAPTYSPDGTWIAYLGHEFGNEGTSRNTRVMVVPSRGGEPVSLTDRLDRPAVAGLPAGGATMQWSPRSDAVLFLALDRGTIGLRSVAVRSKRVTNVLDGDRAIDAFSARGELTAFTASWTSAPSELYTTSPAEPRPRKVSRANAELLKRVALAKVRRISHVSFDGTSIESFVVEPAGARPALGAPLVLEIHGGPHGWHPSGQALHYHQCLAAAGFAVLLPNPRGSSGYGEAFTQACVQDWGGGDFEDLMRAVDAAVDKGIADPRRLCVGGYSYGGFMTSWAVGHTSRFRSAVIGAPVSDNISMFGTTDIPLFSIHQHGGTPFERPDEYVKRSPITYLQDVRTPVLLLHWDGDLRCPIGQSEQIFAGLKVLGRKVELVRYPGGSHVGRTPSQAVDRIRRVIDWHATHATRPARRQSSSRARRA